MSVDYLIKLRIKFINNMIIVLDSLIELRLLLTTDNTGFRIIALIVLFFLFLFHVIKKSQIYLPHIFLHLKLMMFLFLYNVAFMKRDKLLYKNRLWNFIDKKYMLQNRRLIDFKCKYVRKRF